MMLSINLVWAVYQELCTYKIVDKHYVCTIGTFCDNKLVQCPDLVQWELRHL